MIKPLIDILAEQMELLEKKRMMRKIISLSPYSVEALANEWFEIPPSLLEKYLSDESTKFDDKCFTFLMKYAFKKGMWDGLGFKYTTNDPLEAIIAIIKFSEHNLKEFSDLSEIPYSRITKYMKRETYRGDFRDVIKALHMAKELRLSIVIKD